MFLSPHKDSLVKKNINETNETNEENQLDTKSLINIFMIKYCFKIKSIFV